MSVEKEKFVLHGPTTHKPIPEESLGIQIYNSLRSGNPTTEIMVDAFTGKSVKKQEFLEITCRLSRSLSNCGYNTNDIIGICSENSTKFFLPVIAALYQGICLAPINHNYTENEILHVLNISRPKLVFCSDKCKDKFVKLREFVPYLQRIVVFDLKERVLGVDDFNEFVSSCSRFSVEHFRPVDVNTREHLAVLLCSSGTTGLPKAVMITHRNINHNLVQFEDDKLFNNIPNSSFLGILPFFHAYGLMTSLSNIIKGQRIVVLERFKEELFLESIQKYKISTLRIMPPIVVFLVKSPLVQRHDLSSIREIMCGGANLGKEVEDKIRKMFKLDRMMQAYGLTETTLAVLMMPLDLHKNGSTGKIVSGMSVKVRDLETGENLPAGNLGELCFKGDMIMKGYYRNEEATKGTFADGWLLTGDLGYYDQDGFFFIVDRLKELIKYKGYQVAPAELEAVLLTNPKIKDVAVIGIPDEEAGELPCAFVVKQPGVTLSEEEVKDIVVNLLSPQKHLRGGVRFVDEIPKNPSGKILRRVLRDGVVRKSKL